jgi:hypothetical protein
VSDSKTDYEDVGVSELGERVKAVHGEDVYQAAMQRALAIVHRTAFPVDPRTLQDDPAVRQNPTKVVMADALVVALRSEFLKLLRPN